MTTASPIARPISNSRMCKKVSYNKRISRISFVYPFVSVCEPEQRGNMVWCSDSLIIGSARQYERVRHLAPTPHTHRINFSLIPRFATYANNSKLPLSRVRVHDAHLHALEHLIRSGSTCAFVFEDDVVMASNTTHTDLHRLMTQLPADWSYVNMGRCYAKCAEEECFAPGLLRRDKSLCRHAYAISTDTARDLLQYTRSLFYPGDITWSRFLATNRPNTTFSTTTSWYTQDRAAYTSRNGRRDPLNTCERASRAPSRVCARH